MSQRPRRESVRRPDRYRFGLAEDADILAPEVVDDEPVADEPTVEAEDVPAAAAGEQAAIEASGTVAADAFDPVPVETAEANALVDRMKWGEMVGFDVIKEMVNTAHSKIVTWKKNIFTVPTSQHGKTCFAEATRLLKLFTSKSPWETLALNHQNGSVSHLLSFDAAEARATF